ncbi:MAG: acetylxylan esterase [Candidatus Omnitrophica bacterium]|nr:acetylxylan esterase [Candidatus Omnitrophota bacterium]
MRFLRRLRPVSLCLLLLVSTAGRAELKWEADHGGNRIDGLSHIELKSNTLVLNASEIGSRLVVLRATEPARIEAATGANAALKPGWDGTLGYSLYGLHLEIPSPGRVAVALTCTPPPLNPVVEGPEGLRAYAKALDARHSCFPDEKEAFIKWRSDHRDRLAALLMGGGFPERPPLEARTISKETHSKFDLERVVYHSRPNRENQLLLALPKGGTRPPLLVALHGHEAPWGEADAAAFASGHPDDFCAYFAERGWAVLQPATLDHDLQDQSWTLQGEWTWDAMTALDFVVGSRDIDPERIAVCGLSTGAHLAMNLLALDERVKAGVVGCILSTWNHYRKRFRIPPHCDCGIGSQLPSLLGEQCDWAGLAVPKPVQFQHGRLDAAFCPGADPSLLNLAWNTATMPEAEYEAMFGEVRRAYRILDAADRVTTHLHGGKHQVDNEAAHAWLVRALGIGSMRN